MCIPGIYLHLTIKSQLQLVFVFNVPDTVLRVQQVTGWLLEEKNKAHHLSI